MKKIILASLILGAGAVSEAQVARVFVSVNGNDANDCLQPSTACRTLNGGITKVDTGGEVILVDTGSYAGATITKSVKINVPSGNVAFSGLPITINAPGGVVVLRGLTMKALTPGSGTAIDVQAAAAVFIENCVIDGWNDGVSMSVPGELFVKDSTIRNQSNNALDVLNAGLTMSLDGVRLERNRVGLAFGAGKAGIIRTLFSHHDFGIDAYSNAVVMIDQTTFANSGRAVIAEGGATVSVLNSILTSNDKGLEQIGTGVLQTFGNNVVRGNTLNTQGTITTVAKQ